MACRNCYKYPFCEYCKSPTGTCEKEKSKRIEGGKNGLNSRRTRHNKTT